MYQLHPQLQKDTLHVGRFALCEILLMNDARYPWLILVPQRQDIGEIYQLELADREQLLRESCFVADTMAGLFAADKMNIAALGNMVPQLHLHHIARFRDDACWPQPVWGVGTAQAYSDHAAAARLATLREALAPLLVG